ncbi:MAG: hypothetical protein HY812_14155 [Planctomycetes bacterium]|nr:hypothetical protein [Planctomycetota bacterium]
MFPTLRKHDAEQRIVPDFFIPIIDEMKIRFNRRGMRPAPQRQDVRPHHFRVPARQPVPQNRRDDGCLAVRSLNQTVECEPSYLSTPGVKQLDHRIGVELPHTRLHSGLVEPG